MAISHYQESLDFANSSLSKEGWGRSAIIKVMLGFCHWQKSNLSSENNTEITQNKDNLILAKTYFEQSLDDFENSNLSDLFLKFTRLLGNVLQRLQMWDDLEKLSNKCLSFALTPQPP